MSGLEAMEGRTSPRVIISLILLGATLGFASGVYATFEYLKRPVVDPRAEISGRERATIELIQMGALDWMMACAYDQGRQGEVQTVVFTLCKPKFGIGEPPWPRASLPTHIEGTDHE